MSAHKAIVEYKTSGIRRHSKALDEMKCEVTALSGTN